MLREKTELYHTTVVREIISELKITINLFCGLYIKFLPLAEIVKNILLR
jgi:hypothetical protein